MSLVKLGRARLCLALPRHREQLRSTKNPALYDLFESYALAAQTLDNLLRERPRREALVAEYRSLCLDLQAEIVSFLIHIHNAG